jgi:hypothetical protein
VGNLKKWGRVYTVKRMNNMDITKHEFADSIAQIEVEPLDEPEALVIKVKGVSWLFFDKDDVVAMAKHFNVTEIDLIS